MRDNRICSIEYINGLLDHGLLLGLADDDHSQYLLTDGTRDLTGNWTISSNSITLTNGNVILTNGGISAFGNILITDNNLILTLGDIELGNAPFPNCWTNAGVLTVSDSIVLDTITIESRGYFDTDGVIDIQSASFNGAGLDAPDILTVVGGDAVSPAVRGSDILLTAGGGGVGRGGNIELKTKTGAGSVFGDVVLAEDGGNVIIGNTSVTIDASGNFTNVGNITGSDVDISAGTGNYTTSGSIISTGGGETGKFLTGSAGATVFAFSGGNFDIRAGTGGSSSQNALRVSSAKNFDFYAGNLITTGEINFRDTDISIGSTLTDGVLDMSADVSIDMFYDNAAIGDGVDGQKLNINRRTAQGSDYIRLYVDKDRKGLIGFSGDDDLIQL
ncbi:hypothetical protein LCGC14_0375580, partial [marine sediment metagenome]